ncbi:MAG: hypothetical protein ACTSYI_05110 [Promethearchaeota archaeon]
MTQFRKTPKTFNAYLRFLSDPSRISYIGPRAIFRHNFIPPKIIPRQKKTEVIHGVIQDALEDNYTTNLTLYGLKGAGKNLMMNVIFQWFQLQNNSDKSAKSDSLSPIILPVDCADQELGQIIFTVLQDLCQTLNVNLKLEDAMTWDTITLWNTFKLLLRKCERPVILYMQKIEYVEDEIMEKFLNFAKSTENLHILSSINTGNQFYAFNQFSQLDHRVRLGILDKSELMDVASQRSTMAFKNYIEPTALNLIVDYIIEYGTKVPGSCINILKRIYPIIEEKGEILAEDIRRIIQYHFEGVTIDSLAMVDYVMKTSIEERLFLDYLINHFRNPAQFYIKKNEIRRAYRMTAEELGFSVQSMELGSRFQNITNAQILRPSHFVQNEQKEQYPSNEKDFLPNKNYYLSIPVEGVNQIIDMSFGLVKDVF